MENIEINSKFSSKTVIKMVRLFLESLFDEFVFENLNLEWETPFIVSVRYNLKNREEEDLVKISILEKEKTVINVQGEKNLTVEYFFMELKNIL